MFKLSFLTLSITAISCDNIPIEAFENKINADQKAYWYSNKAEITSYKLKQARYGEIHEGNAILIFVTEPFSIKTWAKANKPTSKDISVLKLNFTKKFTTGIYPYSMMTSTFLPFSGSVNSLKITSSSQEWCGHTFMELKNKRKYKLKIDSYFESESGEYNLTKNYLEDDFWSIIRLNPEKLPKGELLVIPSFFYLRLMHKEAKAYKCVTIISTVNDSTFSYKLTYPELDRSLTINYESKFPFKIISWEESYMDGFGSEKQKLTTTAEKIKTIIIDYWTKNSNKDKGYRNELGLD